MSPTHEREAEQHGPLDLPGPVRLFLVTIGLAAAIGGAIAVFTGDDGAGAAALVTIGLALAALAALAPYVGSFKAGGIEIEILRRQRAEGAVRDLIVSFARPFGQLYAAIRTTFEPGPERTRVLYSLFDTIEDQSRFGHFRRSDVTELFEQEGDGGRIVALAVMSGDPAMRDLDCVLASIRDSRSAFEQYQGLQLAERMVGELSAQECQRLSSAIEEGRHWVGDDSSRLDVLARLDERLGSERGSVGQSDAR